MKCLRVVCCALTFWFVASDGIRASECPWPIDGAGRVYCGPGSAFALVSSDQVVFAAGGSGSVGVWAVLPGGDYAVHDGASNVVRNVRVESGHSYYASIAVGSGACIWSDAADEATATFWFWKGFVLIAVTGLVGQSARWVHRVMGGGGVNE